MKNRFNNSVSKKIAFSKKKNPIHSSNLSFSKSYSDPLLESQFSEEYNLSMSNSTWQEYDLGVAAEEDIVILKSLTDFDASQSFEGSYFVESFEASYAVSPDNTSNVRRSTTETQNRKPVLTTPSIDTPPNSEYNVFSNAPNSTNANDLALSKSINDADDDEDEFIKDMKAILTGKKKFDENSKQVLPKSESQSTHSPSPTLNAPDNRNAIFEQLSQSMKYANAYDLGEFDIEQRLNDFDVLSESKTKNQSTNSKNTSSASLSNDPNQHKGNVSNEDFIVDLDDIVQSSRSHQMQDLAAEIPLDLGMGGRSISGAALMPGDIIISTTNATVSSAIRAATNSPVSHASIYLGNNTVAEIMGSGINIWSIEESLADDSLSVAYRHREMTPERAFQMELFIRQAKDNNTRYDYFSLIRVLPSALIETYCMTLPEASRQQCMNHAQRFRLGTDTNNRFYCSELVLDALRHVGVSLSTITPGWSTPNEILELEHNGTLSYIGHLKTSL